MIGRFISPDTVVQDFTNPQSFNRYSYVTNNPLKYTDPTGHLYAYDSGGVHLPPRNLLEWINQQKAIHNLGINPNNWSGANLYGAAFMAILDNSILGNLPGGLRINGGVPVYFVNQGPIYDYLTNNGYGAITLFNLGIFVLPGQIDNPNLLLVLAEELYHWMDEMRGTGYVPLLKNGVWYLQYLLEHWLYGYSGNEYEKIAQNYASGHFIVKIDPDGGPPVIVWSDWPDAYDVLYGNFGPQ